MTQLRQLVSRPPIHSISGGVEFMGVASTSSGSRSQLQWALSLPTVAAALIWSVGIIRILITPRKPS